MCLMYELKEEVFCFFFFVFFKRWTAPTFDLDSDKNKK